MELDPRDVDALRREKYHNDPAADMQEDLARLASGEPLAYVLGTIPFLGLTIHLDSRPLIPRPETEWWTEVLSEEIGEKHCRVLDLCAGSGAIGCALLKHCPNASVSFGELVPEHTTVIRKNVETNGIDASRTDVCTGNLFAPFVGMQFDVIATNPPYIPRDRTLDASVTNFEPREALYAGPDGLSVIRQIADAAPTYLLPRGSLWMECDVANISEAQDLLAPHFSTVSIRTDQYGRERLLVAQL